ncbi:hypothetical protein NL64_06475 [Pseudomonas fluorescens]|uniref:hypothetical protein n=1 Tax=Pseudomonas fluorescens TaxID=294 RepID=UPI00054B91B8|nr:hypothetical protein [Pseudomonas fluorescens]KII34897.1 hypothetical protein NL64_06475 [Pseudomonas fluorescens]
MKILFPLNRFFTRTAKAEPTPVVVDVDALQEKLRLAQSAHVASARRISAFALEHPDLYRLYFTKAGDKRRQEARHAAA